MIMCLQLVVFRSQRYLFLPLPLRLVPITLWLTPTLPVRLGLSLSLLPAAPASSHLRDPRWIRRRRRRRRKGRRRSQLVVVVAVAVVAAAAAAVAAAAAAAAAVMVVEMDLLVAPLVAIVALRHTLVSTPGGVDVNTRVPETSPG